MTNRRIGPGLKGMLLSGGSPIMSHFLLPFLGNGNASECVRNFWGSMGGLEYPQLQA